MFPNIKLSDATIDLATKLELAIPTDDQGEIDFNEFNQWFNQQKLAKKAFLLESLYASFLQDLNNDLKITADTPIAKKPSYTDIAFWVGVAASGTLLALLDGFLSIAVLLMFFAAPTPLVIIFGVAFAVLAVTLFFAFELAKISSRLGIGFTTNPRKMVDLCLEEQSNIEKIIKKIKADYNQKKIEEIEEYLQLIQVLEERLRHINEVKKQLNRVVDSRLLKVIRYAISTVVGALSFSAGFFSFQAFIMLAGILFGFSVVPTFWPVVLGCVAFGVVAFTTYWLVQRVQLNVFINRLLGFDTKKIDMLVEENEIEEMLSSECKLENGETYPLGKQVRNKKIEIELQEKLTLIEDERKQLKYEETADAALEQQYNVEDEIEERAIEAEERALKAEERALDAEQKFKKLERALKNHDPHFFKQQPTSSKVEVDEELTPNPSQQ